MLSTVSTLGNVQTTLRIGILVVHALTGAVWLGAMVYSLRIVQPRAARFFAQDDDAHEDFLATLAANNRWPVLGLAGLLAATGLGAYALQPSAPAALALHAAKGGLLLAALSVFAYVSWRVWPKRLFSLPEERTALRTTLRHAAYALTALVGAAFALGVAAAQLLG
jgi:hypothetical protein